jgi:hypothetical protein
MVLTHRSNPDGSNYTACMVDNCTDDKSNSQLRCLHNSVTEMSDDDNECLWGDGRRITYGRGQNRMGISRCANASAHLTVSLAVYSLPLELLPAWSEEKPAFGAMAVLNLSACLPRAHHHHYKVF